MGKLTGILVFSLLALEVFGNTCPDNKPCPGGECCRKSLFGSAFWCCKPPQVCRFDRGVGNCVTISEDNPLTSSFDNIRNGAFINGIQTKDNVEARENSLLTSGAGTPGNSKTEEKRLLMEENQAKESTEPKRNGFLTKSNRISSDTERNLTANNLLIGEDQARDDAKEVANDFLMKKHQASFRPISTHVKLSKILELRSQAKAIANSPEDPSFKNVKEIVNSFLTNEIQVGEPAAAAAVNLEAGGKALLTSEAKIALADAVIDAAQEDSEDPAGPLRKCKMVYKQASIGKILRKVGNVIKALIE